MFVSVVIHVYLRNYIVVYVHFNTLTVLPHRYVRANLKLPDEFEYHTLYSPEEVQALLWDLESSLLGPNWTLLYIHVIKEI